MKNTTSSQRLFLFAVLLALLGPGYAYAQQTDFRVGADVEIFCECPGRSGWTKGRVESIERVGPTNVFKVRYSSDPAHTKRVLPGKIRDPKLHQQQQAQLGKEKAEADMRAAFFRETHTPYYASVRSMMMVHDMDLVDGSSKSGPPVDPKEWDKVVSDLAALDDLCKTKYAGMVNSESEANSKRKELMKLPATWCTIAANRVEYEKRGRAMALRSQFSRPGVLDELKAAMTNQDNGTPDEAQAVLYNRAAWKAKRIADIQPRFTALKTEVPTDLFDAVFAKADELKAVIEKGAPNRSWTPPPYRDAAVENFIKNKFATATEFKGAKVVKIGLDYTTWKKRESHSYVGSDSKYAYYKVTYNSYKRGVALVKMPGQPFCQAREWIVGRGGSGIVLVSLGGSGIFMKCE